MTVSTRSRTIPASDTAGATAIEGPGARRSWRARAVRTGRAFAVKIGLVLAVFIAVPVILYNQFQAADEAKLQLLLRSSEEQGRMVADTLRPHLEQFGPRTANQLGEALTRLGSPSLNTKILFRPRTAEGVEGFYYVASSPAVPIEYLENERRQLIGTGVLQRVPAACDRYGSASERFTNPEGEEEILVSITPIYTSAGCWVVIASRTPADYLGAALARPYWQTPEIRFAAVIYLLMAVFVVSVLLDGWRSLRGFASLARRIRTGDGARTTFGASNRVPELDGVAREFDRMVQTLHASARMIRYAAEDNAHAFKTPIAVIAQSLEPLRRSLPPADEASGRALKRIEQSIDRLDVLVSAARQMDEAAAAIVDAPHTPIDLAALGRRVVEGYSVALKPLGLSVALGETAPATVLGSEEMLETVVENLMENAIDFSPKRGVITLSLRRDGATALLTVEDRGPGVAPDRLERIFERYFSERPPGHHRTGRVNFGIGLWIVRRNVEALGGSVAAENRPGGGLTVTVRLPLA